MNLFTLESHAWPTVHSEIDVGVQFVADDQGRPDGDEFTSLALLLHVEHHTSRLLEGGVVLRVVGQL